MNDVLYRWPKNAAFGRVVPKVRFYEHGNVRAAVKQKFVSDLQRITWAYKLAEVTVHLEGSSAVPEIQVFSLDAKGADVDDDLLRAIDRSVHFPTVFEVIGSYEGCARVRMTAAQKQLGATTPKVGSYFTTEWHPTDTPRVPLPTAIDLPTLYEAILMGLLPVGVRRGESMSDVTGRIEQSRKLEREIAALERKLRNEPQLNRKVELRRTLKDRQAALADLA